MAAGHQITITPSQLHVEVTLDGEKLAASDRAVLLEETGYPTRYYIPREDVRTELLRPTSHHTTCPFKGEASYWSAEVGGQVHENLVWSYETPIPRAERITDLMCFYPDRVELTVERRAPAGLTRRQDRAGQGRSRRSLPAFVLCVVSLVLILPGSSPP